ncbi:hypothetical protein L195_g007905 [Trifolium pratense]|uniref:Uncharacterized protein n=1 Tax=Trifolium pratense TaxID=57577 RepID=A0A2K3P7P2_TRIPR|nr:hypothetical protein L195_g007905 [Trifolium pratense]
MKVNYLTSRERNHHPLPPPWLGDEGRTNHPYPCAGSPEKAVEAETPGDQSWGRRKLPPSSKFDVCKHRWRPSRQKEQQSENEQEKLQSRKKERALSTPNLWRNIFGTHKSPKESRTLIFLPSTKKQIL